ncbi:hypothetical protein EGN72_07625 [Pseudorhodobacter sp. E13]|uniref:hypothetical protein n=1 Tax=Pseudorhodobacter sp. E13 TaxID=2487931 RepID=UPI000F8E3290|nr:hypothetical protein [Pseudorhodobacter sp. E13]RUS60760.1 hypothetical protein EGN72_07625 [Pseudorhodobacter sp. E13]
MSFIRPEARAALWRGREVFAALGLGAIGLWCIALGGLVLAPVGAAIAALAAGFGLLAWRRLRFAQTGDAPGVVELDEGQISYFGPSFGGAVALRELVELRLLTVQARRVWRLRQQDGQVLLIPVEAAGADRLFDAFASLPGMDSRDLVDAVSPPTADAAQGRALVSISDSRVIWRHPARAVLT